MCRDLRALRQSICEYAEGFDIRELVPSQANEVVKLCSSIEASVTAMKNLALAKSAEGTAWKHLGYRSPADQVAKETGMSPGRAKRALETGQRLSEQPEVAQAALSGELSPDQAEAVSDGVAANPDKATELIDKASELSMPELNEEVAKAKAAGIDLEARRRAIHAKRSLTRRTDRDGAFHAHLYGNPDAGISLSRVIDPIRQRLVLLRRSSEMPRETFEAVDHDALLTLAAVAAGQDSELNMKDLLDLGLFPQLDHTVLDDRAGIASTLPPPANDRMRKKRPPGSRAPGGRAKVIVRVDLDALLRGYPLEGELCEIKGYGPVPVSMIEDLVATGNTFVAAALMQHHEVKGVHHHRRRPNAHQKTALEFVYPECAVKGCNAREGLQADHREDWARTHFTVFDLLDHLCFHHHALKTRKGWALVEGRGKRDFVPPDDPRHPRYKKPPGQDQRPPVDQPSGQKRPATVGNHATRRQPAQRAGP